MNIDDIKKAVDLGKTVHWSNEGYQVVKSKDGDSYGVLFLVNDNYVNLEFEDSLQGDEADFFLSDADKSLYRRMKDAQLIVGSHESDLYVLDTANARTILEDFPDSKKNASGFTSETGEGRCLDLPFTYEPFWDKVVQRQEASPNARFKP